MMKIMYLLFSYTVGGTERLVTNICNQMCLSDNDIYLYIVNDLIDENLVKTLDSKIHVEFLKRKVGSKDKITPLIKIARFIKQNNIDVVHCNSFNAPELLILSKIVNPKCRIISTIHGVGQFNNVSKLKISIKNWVCDEFIGISDSVKKDILDVGISEDKVIRIYNGIDTHKYNNAVYKPFDKENVILGCVARIMPSIKGQDVLIKATKILKEEYPNIKVVLAGGVAKADIKEYQKLEKYIIDNKLSESVTFLGSIDDVPGFLKTIDICVVPSRSEGFGLALVEAMSMGVPCVASNIAGPKEIVLNEGYGFLFECGNEIDLAKQIKCLISNYNEAKMCAFNKRESIKEKYSIETMCEMLIYEYCK